MQRNNACNTIALEELLQCTWKLFRPKEINKSSATSDILPQNKEKNLTFSHKS